MYTNTSFITIFEILGKAGTVLKVEQISANGLLLFGIVFKPSGCVLVTL